MNRVVTICYGKAEQWNSREEAENFYHRAMMMCEGAEQERYLNIYCALKEGNMVCGDGEKHSMTNEVVNQILSIRQSGRTNMFDLKAVQKLAYELEFYELVIFLEDEPEKYSRFILNGEVR